MAAKPLPMIPRRYVNAHGNVALWDMAEEGGPVQIVRAGILAREALGRDPERYRLELPKNVKPGPAQLEAEQRAREEADELNTDIDRDPVYGRKAQ